MAELDPETYARCEEALMALLDEASSGLRPSDREVTAHYLQHAELEMAFEILGLAVLRQRVAVRETWKDAYVRLGARLEMDNERAWTYSATFWPDIISHFGAADQRSGEEVRGHDPSAPQRMGTDAHETHRSSEEPP